MPWFLINYRLIALQATEKLFEGTLDINIYIYTKFSHILAEDHHGKLKYVRLQGMYMCFPLLPVYMKVPHFPTLGFALCYILQI